MILKKKIKKQKLKELKELDKNNVSRFNDDMKEEETTFLACVDQSKIDYYCNSRCGDGKIMENLGTWIYVICIIYVYVS